MKYYPEDYQVSVTVGFADLNGDLVTPTEVRAALYDQDDQVVVDFGALPFEATEVEKTIVIPSVFNRLGAGELAAGRVLRVQIITAAGTIRRSFAYAIEGEFRLGLMQNTFISMEAAEMLARNTPNLSGWISSSEDQRYAALMEAYSALTRIPMRFETRSPLSDTGRVRVEETIIERHQWPEVTEDDFLAFPADFRGALRKAQLIEANELLEGDAITRRQRAGIVAETIGDSSIRLSGAQIDLGVSKQALSVLTGYVYYNHRIVRG